MFLAAGAGLTFWAGLALFSVFMFYDDEGYVLTSLKNYAEHGQLYGQVYTQYGPFPFVFFHALHALGLPFTHIGGRLVTLACWAGTAVACGALTWRATRSLPTGLAVLAGTFPFLWIMSNESTHPGGLITLLVAANAALGWYAIDRGRLRSWAFLTGCAGAAVALSKINLGAFLVLSAVAWLGWHAASAQLRRWAPVVIAAGGMVIPLLLMRPLLDREWVQTFALLVAGAAVSAALVMPRTAAPLAGRALLGWGLAGAALISAVAILPVLARGTSAWEMIEGVLLNPLRHPVAFNVRFLWPPFSQALAVVSLLGAIAAIPLARRAPRAVDGAVAALRLVTGAGLAVALLGFPDVSPDRLVFAYGTQVLWLFLWPLTDRPAATRAAYGWVACLWLGQYLHAFPVAGSQIAWGTFLALPLAAIGGHEAMQWLGSHLARSRPLWSRPMALLARGTLVVIAAVLALRFTALGDRYRSGSDLGLPGAEIIRLPTESVALFRLLTVNATAHGDMLLAEPGIFSLNLWSGLPTPTLANATHWFSLLSPSQQQAIIQALEAHPRACIIKHRYHIEFLTRWGFAPKGPLHDYLAANYETAFSLDDFDFCVRRGRQIEPLHLGRFELHGDESGVPNTALRLRLQVTEPITVAQVTLTAPQVPNASALVLDARNATAAVAPDQPAAWPLQLAPGEADLTFRYDRFAVPRPFLGGLITFYGPDGSVVALARLHL